MLGSAQAAAENMMRLSGRHGGNTEHVDSDEPFKPMIETASPFPKVEAEHMPPLEEAKEKVLWDARDVVLSAQNVKMQLTWARDVLAWAQIATNFRNREDEMDGGSRKCLDIEKTTYRERCGCHRALCGSESPRGPLQGRRLVRVWPIWQARG